MPCKSYIAARKVGVRKFSTPVAYFLNCTSSDLAVLELEEKLASSSARLYIKSSNPTIESFFASGFGQKKNPETLVRLLKTVTLDIKVCSWSHGYYDSICTVEIKRNFCSGDSGNGLKNQYDVLYGFVIVEIDCNRIYTGIINSKALKILSKKNNGEIFTAVNKHLDFICFVIGNVAGCKPEFAKGIEKFIMIA